jgi:hemerythrin-like domain-containing protein
MLTATYTLVALSVEQGNVRVSLQSLQELIQSNFIHQEHLTPGQVGYALDAVQRMVDSCHWRKLDMFLIPAIRQATADADDLLHSLDELAQIASDAVGALAGRFGAAPVDTPAKVMQFCYALESFCGATLRRLQLEEQELFPVARTVISGEAWFSIANEMLAHEAYLQENRPVRTAPVFTELPYEQARQRRVAANLVH